MKIGLFFDNSDKIVRGPYKVAHNLIMGLNKIGIEYSLNTIQEYNGCLQSWIPQYRHLPRNTLMGPNLMVLPTDHEDVWKLYDRFLVNSQWTLDMYKSFNVTNKNIIYIWPVGIDTYRFSNAGRVIKKDCFIYFKNRDRSELDLVINELNKRRLSHEIITYGDYEEDRLIDLSKNCNFCILLTHTESQGIAYMEILASGIPCFVLNQNVLHYQGYTFSSSSVPYFSEECGVIAEGLDFSKFDYFLNSLASFDPRKYIIENHTLEISARNYLNFLLADN